MDAQKLGLIVLRKSLYICGAGLTALGLFADWFGLGSDPGIGLTQAVMIVFGGLLLVGGVTIGHPNFLYSVYLVITVYAFSEIGITWLYLADVIDPPTIWAYEDSGKTIQFDPVRGYRLTPTPSRIAGVTRGTIEYVGVIKGNNEGFPDRDDFYPERKPDATKRFAVFGDTFTAAQYIAKNWPDQVEDLTRERGRPVQLLNFSVDGAGLANWWSVLTRIVQPEGYKIDGVIFAVFPDDLRRTFTVADDRGASRHRFGRIPSWDMNTIPTSLQEAQPYLSAQGYVVSQKEFEELLQGRWKPPSDKTVRPFLAWKVWQTLAPPKAKPVENLHPGAIRLMEDIKRSITAIAVPALVIHVPTRPELTQPEHDADRVRDAQYFAAILNAKFLDGTRAFENKGPEEIRAMWLPYDGHWGQKGSDRFAEFMADFLLEWP